MSKFGPIVYIEDDDDDYLLFQDAIQDLKVENELRHFNNCEDAYEYLCATTDDPLVILCDINFPKMSGLELRNKIDASPTLRKKAVPYVFFGTGNNRPLVDEAFKNNIQGFFVKPTDFKAMKLVVKTIINYWQFSKAPMG